MDKQTINKSLVLGTVLVISLVFFVMIKQFFMVIIFAGIFAAMCQPLFNLFMKWFKGRKNLSSVVTLLIVVLLIFLPLLAILTIVAGQAVKLSHTITPFIQAELAEPNVVDKWLTKLPFTDYVLENKEMLLTKIGELIGKTSTLLFESVSNVTLSAVNFFFLFFLFLYTMFFFIKDGHAIFEQFLYYLPLTDKDEKQLLNKFTSVTRATIKGTFIIGIIQGGSAGLAFWVLGINNALFWGTIMTILSIIPAIGTALVWIPAVIYFFATGAFVKAIILWIFCGLLVGSVDNVLRPKLVGKDTEMHELFILFGTLGGISLFGILGFIVGPIVAAMFVTVLSIYAETFKTYLPHVEKAIEPEPEQNETESEIDEE